MNVRSLLVGMGGVMMLSSSFNVEKVDCQKLKVLIPAYVDTSQSVAMLNYLKPIASITYSIISSDTCGYLSPTLVTSVSKLVGQWNAAGFNTLGYLDPATGSYTSGPGCCTSGNCGGQAGEPANLYTKYVQYWNQVGVSGIFFDDCAEDTSAQVSNIVQYAAMAKGVNSSLSVTTNSAGFNGKTVYQNTNVDIYTSYEDLCSGVGSGSSKYTDAKHAAICYGSGSEQSPTEMATIIQNAYNKGFTYLSIWPSSAYTNMPSATWWKNFVTAMQNFNGAYTPSTTSPPSSTTTKPPTVAPTTVAPTTKPLPTTPAGCPKSSNLLQNSLFSSVTNSGALASSWSTIGSGYTLTTRKGEPTLKLTSNDVTVTYGAKQTITLNQPIAVTSSVSFGAYISSSSITGLADSKYILSLALTYTDNTVGSQTINLQTGSYGWTFQAQTFTPKKAIQKIDFIVSVTGHTGRVYLTGPVLGVVPSCGLPLALDGSADGSSDGTSSSNSGDSTGTSFTTPSAFDGAQLITDTGAGDDTAPVDDTTSSSGLSSTYIIIIAIIGGVLVLAVLLFVVNRVCRSKRNVDMDNNNKQVQIV